MPSDLPIDEDLQDSLEDNNLVYLTDKSPGFFRQSHSAKATRDKGPYIYYDLQGKKITDEKNLKRIASLAIPPAWKQVWVSPKPNSHLQVTGIDDKNRKQYLYHPKWIKLSHESKFSKIVDFGLSLPKIRNKISYDMKGKSLDKKRLLATIVWLLEHTFIRIGNEEYSKDNGSYGLTTLRNKHVKVKNNQATFQFVGKSGVSHFVQVSNPKVVKTIRRCVELPGYELFQFIDDEGERHTVDSSDVNQFLKDVTKEDFSAKDFRTWGATNLSANSLYSAGQSEDLSTVKRNINETVKKVAAHLRNTVNVCRNYYIHPTVISTYQRQLLVPHFASFANHQSQTRGLHWDEYALVKLLQKHPLD